MKQAKIISRVFGISSIVLLCAACSFVGYQYRAILCSGLHEGGSAPAWIAFLFAIPFLIAVGACFALYLYFGKKHEVGSDSVDSNGLD